jgi:hypothetical protein
VNPGWHHQYHTFAYSVGGRTFTNKLEALDAARQELWRITLDWNHNFWATQDWTEPTQSMEELCQDFALRLRDRFKKIYVSFSGGWDSWTVVKTFHDAGIKIDGLVLLHRTWMIPEEWDYIKSRTKELKEKIWPDLDIVVIEYDSRHILKSYHSLQSDWIATPGFEPRLSKNPRKLQFDSDPTSRSLAHDPDCIILDGNDKPRLDILDGKWCARFLDGQIPFFHESPTVPFFINTQAPLIHIKQSHLLKHWMLSRGVRTHQDLHSLQSRFNSDDMIYRSSNLAIRRHDPGAKIVTTTQIKRIENSEQFSDMTIKDLVHAVGANDADWIQTQYKKGIDFVKQTYAGILQNSWQFLPAIPSPAYHLPG